MEVYFRAMDHNLPYGITQCYLPPNTGKCTPQLNPSQIGWYSIYLPWRDERLSWLRLPVRYRDGLPSSEQSPI